MKCWISSFDPLIQFREHFFDQNQDVFTLAVFQLELRQ